MACSIPNMEASTSANTSIHKLYDNWTLWAHLPHDTDWSFKSYKQIITFDNVEAIIATCETLPEKMINNCMLFLMREGITPIWEDVRNRNGGCFSYKVSNKDVQDCWRQLTYSVVGNSISSNKALLPVVNGFLVLTDLLLVAKRKGEERFVVLDYCPRYGKTRE